MPALDVKKDLKQLFNPSAKEPSIVEVPPMNFLMVDGEGNPNTSIQYSETVQALYTLSYTLKFALKKGPEQFDYSVAPLEGLWWMDDMTRFSTETKDEWKWTMMIMQPLQVTPELLEKARAEALKKKKLDIINRVRLETFDEGLSAQIMHIGPYATEAPTIQKLHTFIHNSGYELRDKHHEIYLNDPNRTAPEKLKTIIRQPVSKSE
jgi:hypothetical protein